MLRKCVAVVDPGIDFRVMKYNKEEHYTKIEKNWGEKCAKSFDRMNQNDSVLQPQSGKKDATQKLITPVLFAIAEVSSKSAPLQRTTGEKTMSTAQAAQRKRIFRLQKLVKDKPTHEVEDMWPSDRLHLERYINVYYLIKKTTDGMYVVSTLEGRQSSETDRSKLMASTATTPGAALLFALCQAGTRDFRALSKAERRLERIEESINRFIHDSSKREFLLRKARENNEPKIEKAREVTETAFRIIQAPLFQ